MDDTASGSPPEKAARFATLYTNGENGKTVLAMRRKAGLDPPAGGVFGRLGLFDQRDYCALGACCSTAEN